MKKATLLVLTAVLLAVAMPAYSQDFPDVPPDHWAYDAVQELVDWGIIQGYPDGLYRGKRAMTRYEFAEALAKAIPAILDAVDAGGGAPGREGPPGPAGEKGEKGDPGPGTEQVQALQRLVDELRDELAAVGVDVEALRRDVAALNERVTAVEDEQKRVVINASGDMIGRATVMTSGAGAVDKDLRAMGAMVPTMPKDLLANSEFYNNLGLTITGKVAEDAKLVTEIAAGNYLSNFIFPMSAVDDFTLWNFYLDGTIGLGPLGKANIIGGRFPLQLTPLTLKFVDPDSYTWVDKLDKGDYVVDGAAAKLDFGSANLMAFAAKTDPIADLISPDLMLGWFSGEDVIQIGGARLAFNAGSTADIGVTYYQAGLTPPMKSDVYGADINLKFSNVSLAGEFAQVNANDALKLAYPGIDDDNTAYTAKLGFGLGGLELAAGYSAIESNYYAPGSWSRVGRGVNLVNVQGYMGSLKYNLSPNVCLMAEGNMLEPKDSTLPVRFRTSLWQGPAVALGGLDKITSWKAGLKYGLTSSNSIDLGYEMVNWEPTAGTKAEESFISIGFGHDLNPNASIKLLYQIMEHKAGTVSPLPDFEGGVATAQVQLKY